MAKVTSATEGPVVGPRRRRRRKVDEVHEGEFDKSLCGNQELSLAHSKPAKTICVEKP